MPDEYSTYFDLETPTLQVNDIQWDNEEHTMKIGRICITFTPTEYRLLFPLRSGIPITYAQMAHLAYRYTLDDKVRAMMDKHIDRIRGKMRGSGFYIYCILSYGYLLLPNSAEEDAHHEINTTKIALFRGKHKKH